MATIGGVFIAAKIAGLDLGTGRNGVIANFELDEREKSATECKIELFFSSRQTPREFAKIVKGVRAQVRFGYLGQMSDLHEMVVHSIEPAYTEQGTKLLIVLRDRSALMGRRARVKVWENTQLGDVVKEICRDYGLTVRLPPIPRGVIGQRETTKLIKFDPRLSRRAFELWSHDGVPPSPEASKLLAETVSLAANGRSDRALLHWIAHRTGCHLQVVGKEARFVPEAFSAPPAIALRWRDGGQGVLRSFQTTASEGGKTTLPARGTKTVGTDRTLLEAFAFTAKDDTRPGRPVLGRASSFGGVSGDGQKPSGGERLIVSSKRGGEVIGRGTTPVRRSNGAGIPGVAADALGLTDLANSLEPAVAALGKVKQVQALKEFLGVVLPIPSGKKTDAQRTANAVHGEAESGGIKAQFSAVGISTLRRGLVMQVASLPFPQDNGSYLITQVTHKINAQGYQVTGEAKRHGLNTSRQAKTKGRPNETKPRDANAARAPASRYLVSSKLGGEIVGVVKR